MERALIYVPADDEQDGEYAARCLAFAMTSTDYAHARYGTHPMICREWDQVQYLLDTGWARTVIVARAEHGASLTARIDPLTVVSLDEARRRRAAKTANYPVVTYLPTVPCRANPAQRLLDAYITRHGLPG